ncbi:hypothetical protein GUJ93_ZPchr0006g41398 [Zizania palustris]|uniref:Uncharacterized protein n=1 Tax=Zizania palustris TaxID=103762 RepID=A0A8J5VTU3_ZIZPA|nr:hypothetical protein GUJ93_ZPchr0006g41398 [Zizania palustris]
MAMPWQNSEPTRSHRPRSSPRGHRRRLGSRQLPVVAVEDEATRLGGVGGFCSSILTVRTAVVSLRCCRTRTRPVSSGSCQPADGAKEKDRDALLR